jgi:predicted nucleic acid-binding protein
LPETYVKTSSTDILLDTSALIAFLQGDGTGDEVRYVLKEGRGIVSAISVYELFAGVRSEARRDQRAQLLALTRVVPVDEPIARRGADLLSSLRRLGITIANEDLLIAATALERAVPILTGDARHFESVPGVRLVIPESGGIRS